MAFKKNVPIDYTSRDFNSIKEDLVDYAKRYYPNTFKDFNEASFGSLMLDSVAYIGDILSFYLDYQANESFLSTAAEYDNILKLGKQVGYNMQMNPSSFGTITLFCVIPATEFGTPDVNYCPVVRKNSTFNSENNVVFSLLEDVNFANPSNETVVAGVDETNGNPTSFVVKAHGQVKSGQFFEEIAPIGSFERFKEVRLANRNITEILSVLDEEGHQYFEVDYLSQDTVYVPIRNTDTSTNTDAPNILRAFSVPRRFVTENERGAIVLKFGYGSDNELKDTAVTHPSEVILDKHGKFYETDESFDPAKLVSTDKFGISPSNTNLTIVYRANTADDVNVPSESVTTPIDVELRFGPNAINQAKRFEIRASLEVTNEEPIVGDVSLPGTDELKQRINDTFSSQNRAVTKQDYMSMIYRMPPTFGKIKRCNIVQDNDSFKRNMNLYVISEDVTGKFTQTNSIIKQNLKSWINQYKMINDTIDIMDAKIINYGVNFTVVGPIGTNKHDVLRACLDALKQELFLKLEIGEGLWISRIYQLLNSLALVVDVTDVRLVAKTGGIYSDVPFSIDENISPDGRYLHIPEDHILELKFANTDVAGTVK